MREMSFSELWCRGRPVYVGDLADMRRRKRRILIGGGVVVFLGILCLLTPYTRRHYTCLQCRLDKTVETYWGIKRVTETPNKCSRWYLAAHPGHEHDWKKSSCTFEWRAFTRCWRCGSGHPVFHVIPEVQKTYLSASTGEQVEAWFALLESKDRQDHQKAYDLAYEPYWRWSGVSKQRANGGAETASPVPVAEVDPNETVVVMEILDRPAFREAMPVAQGISPEQYRQIRDKYTTNNPAWRAGSALTYRVREGDEWRTCWLALVLFDRTRATIAELMQFRSKGWDWVAAYEADRSSEIEADFGVERILAERAKVVGGVQYGMSVADVIGRKGRHFKVSLHAEEGSARLVYDDVAVGVRQWHAGGDAGRVVGVEPVTDEFAAEMKDIPYEDEK